MLSLTKNEVMKKSLFIAIISAMFITSCSPRIVGTWNVDRYEVDNQKGQNLNVRNAGEITFRKNGTGEKDIQYNMFQNQLTDSEEFRWTMQADQFITLTSPNKKEESEFDKTWIIVTDKKKKQVWKSTDGRSSVQVLELSKK